MKHRAAVPVPRPPSRSRVPHPCPYPPWVMHPHPARPPHSTPVDSWILLRRRPVRIPLRQRVEAVVPPPHLLASSPLTPHPSPLPPPPLRAFPAAAVLDFYDDDKNGTLEIEEFNNLYRHFSKFTSFQVRCAEDSGAAASPYPQPGP